MDHRDLGLQPIKGDSCVSKVDPPTFEKKKKNTVAFSEDPQICTVLSVSTGHTEDRLRFKDS